MTQFGPEYSKIHTVWKRDTRGVVIPGEWAIPEFEYLANNLFNWTEKINGTNGRLHWNGKIVTVNGRTNDALLPATLYEALRPLTSDTERWGRMFPSDDADVTICGEFYGAGIAHGSGKYRPDIAMIVFDVLVHDPKDGIDWWLQRPAIENVAAGLELDVVPVIGQHTLREAWELIKSGTLKSAWENVPIEGIVGKPAIEFKTRKGERLIAKLKTADWTRFLQVQEDAEKALLREADKAARKLAYEDRRRHDA